MKIRGILALSFVSVFAAGIAMGQEASASKKRAQPLRNTSPRTPKVRPLMSPEFGGVGIQYQRVSVMQFTSDVSTDTYTSTWNPDFDGYDYQRYFVGDGFNHLVSSPTIPGGARIVYVELDACDASTTDLHLNLTVWNCDFEGFCDDTPLTSLTTVSDVPDPCHIVTDSAISHRVNNFLGQTLLDVKFGASDGTNSFSGVVLGYVLEPSPAPAVATFNDVPTGHIFFQFIEALAASGVTGGCQQAPPLFCPDSPVTRGQMATFLAKALGLGWE